jgi:hypothetical protein
MNFSKRQDALNLKTKITLQLVMLYCLLGTGIAMAEFEFSRPEISGFGSVGMGLSDNPTPYLRELEVTNRLSVAGFNKVGVQLNGWLPLGNSYVMQLLAKNGNEHFDVKLDWMLIAREINRELTLRAGLLRMPIYLYSKSIEVGTTYPWILPPESVYGTTELTNYHGVDLIYRKSYKDITLEIQPLVGETQNTISVASAAIGELEVKTNRNFGIAGRLSGPDFVIHGAYIRLDSETSFLNPIVAASDNAGNYIITGTYEFITLAAKMMFNDWTFAAETSHRATSNLELVDSVDGYYVLLGYRNGQYLYHLTYSVLFDDDDEVPFIINRDNKELIAGINYELGSYQTLKYQLTYGDPKNGSIGNFRQFLPDIDDVFALMVNYNWVF